MYRVVIDKPALKALAKIPSPSYDKINEALKLLASNPRPHGYKKLKGRPGYRIRVGDYRIIYTVNDDIVTVFILLVGNRKDIYE